jgi:DNA end-binding protein Ku
MWKGAVSFGMVAIPVRLYLATESKSISFRSLCPCHKQPIKQKRHCPVDEEVIEWSEVLRGFEIEKDQFVILADDDLDNLPLPSAHTIDIAEFVDAGDIPGELYMKQAYYIEPEKTGIKPYYLLKKSLQEMHKVAVGKVALRDREHMATIRPHGHGMVVNTLHWPDEIRDIADLNLPEEEVKIEKREKDMAKMLIDNLAAKFDPKRYRDEYREALLAVARAKAEGHEITVAEAPQPKVMDLMAALKASVEASKKGGRPAEHRPATRAKPRVVGGRRKAAGAAKPRAKVARAS